MTRNDLARFAGAKVRIVFDDDEVLAELKADDPAAAFVIFSKPGPSRHRHLLTDEDVAGLTPENRDLLRSPIRLYSLAGEGETRGA